MVALSRHALATVVRHRNTVGVVVDLRRRRLRDGLAPRTGQRPRPRGEHAGRYQRRHAGHHPPTAPRRWLRRLGDPELDIVEIVVLHGSDTTPRRAIPHVDSVAVSAARSRIAGWGLALLAVGNGLVVVALWGVDGARDMHDTAGVLTGLGRVTGLLGAYLALVQLLLLARLPVLDRLVGLHRLTAWHRAGGFAVLALLVAHTLSITAGYTVGDNISLAAEIDRLITGYPGVITATAGLVALIGVTVTSIVIVRRRLSYETWYFVHLYAYLGIVLAFSHQLATGSDFVGDSLARAYWYALYIATLGAIVGFRIALPVVRSLRHRLRVASVSEEGPGVVSVEIGGVRARAPARAHRAVLHVALPHARALVPGAPVLAVGGARPEPAADHRQGRRRLQHEPAHAAAGHARDRRRPVRVVHRGDAPPRAGRADRRRHRHHADPRAARGHARRAGRHRRRVSRDRRRRRDPAQRAGRARAAGAGSSCTTCSATTGRASSRPEHLQELIPDIAARDVYVCGPPAMTEATRASLDRSGVPRRHIFTERFAL